MSCQIVESGLLTLILVASSLKTVAYASVCSSMLLQILVLFFSLNRLDSGRPKWTEFLIVGMVRRVI